jgi:hypothetical protein
VITIRSNDELTPTVTVPVKGRGNLAPRAIAWGCPTLPNQIGCDGQQKDRRFTASIRADIGLDGRESFDPEGKPIESFQWKVITRPMGSNAAVFNSTDDRTLRKSATGDFEVDLVGSYDLRLIVRDSRGVASLDRPESHVLITPKDLEVLLKWDVPTDVDLHLVHPGGRVGDYGNRQAGTSTGTDCSTFNRAPNWNDLMSVKDDPRLDIDDVRGRGPEVVSLDTPESGGPYRVWAHYCDSQRVGVPVDVTVEIYVRGVLIQSIPDQSRLVQLRSGQALQMAEIDWDPALPMIRQIRDTSTGTPTSAPGLCMIQ